MKVSTLQWLLLGWGGGDREACGRRPNERVPEEFCWVEGRGRVVSFG